MEELATHPHIGPEVPELEEEPEEFRQLVISKHHRVIYRVEEERVLILTVHPTRIPFSLWIEEP